MVVLMGGGGGVTAKYYPVSCQTLPAHICLRRLNNSPWAAVFIALWIARRSILFWLHLPLTKGGQTKDFRSIQNWVGKCVESAAVGNGVQRFGTEWLVHALPLEEVISLLKPQGGKLLCNMSPQWKTSCEVYITRNELKKQMHQNVKTELQQLLKYRPLCLLRKTAEYENKDT